MSLYDYPHYYDLVYGSDWKAEHDFLVGVFARHARRPVRRVLEPACGTGRLMFRLARSGFQICGFDLNERAVQYCNRRLEKHGFPATAWIADMADFAVPRPVCAAFNMINSFRHLQRHEQAVSHLRCIQKALRSGGVYVLGLHLCPTKGTPAERESWSARRGHLSVQTDMQLVEQPKGKRFERYRMTYDVWTPTRHEVLEDEFTFRTYSRTQFEQELLGEVPELVIQQTYDFGYDLQNPVAVHAETQDVVYVLQKR